MTPAVLVTGDPSADELADLTAACRRAGAELFIARDLVPRRPDDPPGAHRDEHPECTCRSCRVRAAWLTATGEEHALVLAGAEEADITSARCADVVIAAGGLRPACQRENITFHAVSSLREAAGLLDALCTGRGMRKRWTAEQHRRALFLAEA